MANTLRFKRGLVSAIPTAAAGEPLFTTDTFDLYIGNGTGNTRFQKYIASGTTSQLLRGDGSLLTMPIVLTSPSNGQVLKYNGTSWVNDSDAGITGSGVAGQVAYFSGATTIGGGNNFFWDSSNNRLGLATNAPSYRLHIVGNGYLFGLTGGGTTRMAQVFSNTGGGLELGVEGSAGGTIFTNASAYASVIGSNNATPLQFATNASVRATLDTSGNLGLGVTPSAWQTMVGMNIGDVGSFGSKRFAAGNTQTIIGNNVFYDNTGFKYITTDASSWLRFVGDQIRFNLAPSGTANTLQTITQAMTLTANGRLLLGTTTEGTQRLQVAGDVKFDADAATNGFYWDNTNKRLGIGRTSPLSTLHLGSTGGSPIYLEDTDATSTYNITSISNNAGNFNLETRSSAGAFVRADYQIVKETLTSQYHRWFNGNSSEIVRFDNNGSVGIGTTSPGNDKLSVVGSGRFTTGLTSGTAFWQYAHYFYNGGGTNDIFASTTGNNAGSGNFAIVNTVSGGRLALLAASDTTIRMGNNTQTAATASNFVLYLNTGNLGINSSSDTGEKLQVTGTMKVTGASTFGGNLTNTNSNLRVFGSTDYASSTWAISIGNGSSSNNYYKANNHYFQSANGVTGVELNSNGTLCQFSSFGTTSFAASSWGIVIGNGLGSANFYKANQHNFQNGSGTAVLTIDSAGAATFSSSVTATTLTTTRATTGINNYLQFLTGATTNWQIGTPSSQTALSFLDAGAEAFRIDTGGIVSLGGNFGIGGATFGTSATRTLAMTNGVAPTTSVTDRFQMYSNDIVAGNAAPHFRTENGAVVKIYQETTGVGNSIFSQGGGNSVLDDSTFDGYTLRQIVKALRNQGILQ